MLILLLKTVHIIGFVAWFAAMFYLGRLFVYHKEALEGLQNHHDTSHDPHLGLWHLDGGFVWHGLV